MIRRLLICCAFATWCFLNTWVEFAEGHSFYFARYHPLRAVALPVVCWQILIALGMFALWEFWRRRRSGSTVAAHVVFLAACFVPVGIASVAVLRVLPFDAVTVIRKPLFWPAVFVAGAAPLVFAMRRPRAASRAVRGVLLYSWPVLALILTYAALNLFRLPEAAFDDAPMAATLPGDVKRVRVIWVIFDELSQEIVFSDRPAGLQLPSLDRLRAESFHASAAQSPSAATLTSLPSLILGERVTATETRGPNRALLTLEGEAKPVEWGEAPNVFDAAYRTGHNTALVGWYHPYGRLLSRSLTKCDWSAGWLFSGVEEPTWPRPLAASLWDRARLQLAAMPLVGHLAFMHPNRYQRKAKIERYSYLLTRAQEIAADPTIGLALLHLPVPHPPAIYSRSTGRFSWTEPAGYLDSVALADRTLGTLRRAIQAAGLWERTAVIISSDHGWRTSVWRAGPDWTSEDERVSSGPTMGVPFLLKLPGQTGEICYDKRFNTVVTSRIVTAILEGRLTDPARIGEAIERFEQQLRLRS